jgi:hypothetical protein
LCKISDFHSSGYSDCSFLGCGIMWFCRWTRTFRGTCYLYIQVLPLQPWKWKQQVPPKHWYPPTRPVVLQSRRPQSIIVFKRYIRIIFCSQVKIGNHYGKCMDHKYVLYFMLYFVNLTLNLFFKNVRYFLLCWKYSQHIQSRNSIIH